MASTQVASSSTGGHDSLQHTHHQSYVNHQVRGAAPVQPCTQVPFPTGVDSEIAHNSLKNRGSSGVSSTVEEVLEYIRHFSSGCIRCEKYKRLHQSHHPTFYLPGHQRDFQDLHRRIAQEQHVAVFFARMRKDWSARTGIIKVHYPETPIHSRVTAGLGDLVCTKKLVMQITAPASARDSLEKVLSGIESAGACPVTTNHKDPTSQEHDLENTGHAHDNHDEPIIPSFIKCPDAQWGHRGSPPRVVAEIAYSQPFEAVLQKAHEYFTDSSVIWVLIFDIKYADATARSPPGFIHDTAIYLYSRKHGTKQAIIHGHQFRDKNGDPLDGSLDLPLSIFVPADVLETLPPAAAHYKNAAFQLLNKELTDLMERAEAHQRTEDKLIPKLRTTPDDAPYSEPSHAKATTTPNTTVQPRRSARLRQRRDERPDTRVVP